MKAFLIFASAILLISSSEATFGNHGSGKVALSGNFHGLLSHPLLEKKSQQAPVEAPVIVTEAPIASPAAASASGFSLTGNIHGLFKNHKLLSKFHGRQEQQPAEIVEVPVVVTQAPVVVISPVPSSGFSLGGSIQGLLNNHRFLSSLNKKPSTEAPTLDAGFEGDNAGFSVSTGNSEASEIISESSAAAISESSSSGCAETQQIAQPINDVSTGAVASGSASFSSSGGHNIHKILGDVVGLKVKLLQQVQNGISGRFDNHIKNLDKLAGHFNKNSASTGTSSLHGGFSLHSQRRY